MIHPERGEDPQEIQLQRIDSVLNSIGKNINNMSNFVGRNVKSWRDSHALDSIEPLLILQSSLPGEAEVKEHDERIESLRSNINNIKYQITKLLYDPNLNKEDRDALLKNIQDTWNDIHRASTRIILPSQVVPQKTDSREPQEIRYRYRISNIMKVLMDEKGVVPLSNIFILKSYLEKLKQVTPEKLKGNIDTLIGKVEALKLEISKQLGNYDVAHEKIKEIFALWEKSEEAEEGVAEPEYNVGRPEVAQEGIEEEPGAARPDVENPPQKEEQPGAPENTE